MSKPLRVLFLCTHNSARSILAEAALNHLGGGRFKAYSAGSSPRENQRPNPLAIEALKLAGISTEGMRSKSWDEFAEPERRRAGPRRENPLGGQRRGEATSVGATSDAPEMDLIITVCDNAAGEVCPIWPRHPATAHWGYADPSNVQGDEASKLAAFQHTLQAIMHRLHLLVSLSDEKLQGMNLQTTARSLSNS